MQACLREVAEKDVCRVRLVKGVPVHPKLDADSASAEEGLEDHGQRGLPSVHASVEEANRRGDLPAMVSQGAECIRTAHLPTNRALS